MVLEHTPTLFTALHQRLHTNIHEYYCSIMVYNTYSQCDMVRRENTRHLCKCATVSHSQGRVAQIPVEVGRTPEPDLRLRHWRTQAIAPGNRGTGMHSCSQQCPLSAVASSDRNQSPFGWLPAPPPVFTITYPAYLTLVYYACSVCEYNYTDISQIFRVLYVYIGHTTQCHVTTHNVQVCIKKGIIKPVNYYTASGICCS